MASYKVKPGQIVTGIMRKIFKKKFIVKTKIEYVDRQGKKDIAIVSNQVEAYNKDQACGMARQEIISSLQFSQEATVAK